MGNVDIDQGPHVGMTIVCADASGYSGYVGHNGYNTSGSATDFGTYACLDTPSAATPCTSVTKASGNVGLGNSDVPRLHRTSDGVAVLNAGGDGYTIIVIAENGQTGTTFHTVDLPRQCVEFGTARCESATRLPY